MMLKSVGGVMVTAAFLLCAGSGAAQQLLPATTWSGTAQWDIFTSSACPGSAQVTQTVSSISSGAGPSADDRITCENSDDGTTQVYYENTMHCFSDGSVMGITKNCGTSDTCSSCPAETMRLYYTAAEWAKHDTVGACIEARYRGVTYPSHGTVVLGSATDWSLKLISASPSYPAGLFKFVSPACTANPLPATTATSTFAGPADVKMWFSTAGEDTPACTGGDGVVEATQTITSWNTLSSSTTTKDVSCVSYKWGSTGTEFYLRTETTCTSSGVTEDQFECQDSDCSVCQQTRKSRMIVGGTYPPTTGGDCNTYTNADTGFVFSFQFQNYSTNWADLASQPFAVTTAKCESSPFLASSDPASSDLASSDPDSSDGGRISSMTANIVSVGVVCILYFAWI
eukprot:SAG31_NODE_222_length_19895_cov_34.907626_5_plen_399_part_00